MRPVQTAPASLFVKHRYAEARIFAPAIIAASLFGGSI